MHRSIANNYRYSQLGEPVCRAQSKLLATYKQTERHIYGSSRLGMETSTVELIATDNLSPLADAQPHTTNADDRVYELSNHLGNVLATFTARKLPLTEAGVVVGFAPHVTSLSDYYPFGSGMEGRTVTEGYRYGFNAMEREDDLYAPGSAYDFGARMYDGRLGRWWSVDPYQQFILSQYLAFGNNPVLHIDSDGGWVPGLRSDGTIYLIKEKGDNGKTLIKFFGGPENGVNYVDRRYYYTAPSIVVFNSDNVYSEGTKWFSRYMKSNSNDLEEQYKNGRCHTIALCGTRNQSVIDFQVGSKLNNLSEGDRDRIVQEQYSPLDQNDDGSYDFESQKNAFGTSILTFEGHTAVYFGTSEDGTQYFLSKNSADEYSVDTLDQLIETYGETTGGYQIKDSYSDKPLTENDAE